MSSEKHWQSGPPKAQQKLAIRTPTTKRIGYLSLPKPNRTPEDEKKSEYEHTTMFTEILSQYTKWFNLIIVVFRKTLPGVLPGMAKEVMAKREGMRG